MACQETCLLMFLAAAFIVLAGNESIISVPPVDTTGCYGGISTFHCESDRDDVLLIAWLINSGSITEQVKLTRGITINNDTNSLSIMGLLINNGTSIECIVAVNASSPQVDIAVAIFTVTDIPPVEDLTIVFDNDIMTSAWSQPSCVPVNYSYRVNINNETMNITDTTLQYPVSSCQNYTVSVTVIDTEQPQCHSDTVTETVQSHYIEALDIQLAGTPIVTFDTTDECNVTVPLEFNLTSIPSCPILLHENFTEFLPEFNTTFENFTLNDRLLSFDSTTGIGMFDFGSYNERLKGNYKLSPQTTVPSNTVDFNVSTFNVQDVSITPLSDGTTNITCHFAINSFADGCSVTFTADNDRTIFIAKDDNEDTATSIIAIINGIYSVNVYDVIDEVTNEYAAYTKPGITITHYIDHPSSTGNSSTTMSTDTSTVVMPTTTSISSSVSGSVVATDTPVGSSANLSLPAAVSIVVVALIIILLMIMSSVSAGIHFYKKRDRKFSLTLRGERALVRKPRAAGHDYSDPIPIRQTRTQSPFNDDNNDYFQHSFTFLSGAPLTSPPPPSSYPPPDYYSNETVETTLTTSVNDSPAIDESVLNEYVDHTSYSWSIPNLSQVNTDKTTDGSSPTTSVITPPTSPLEIDDTQQLSAVPKYEFKSNLYYSIIVPGLKLNESAYAEVNLEGFRRPFPRVPDDPVPYAAITTQVPSTPPPIPPKQRPVTDTTRTITSTDDMLSVEETQKGNDKDEKPINITNSGASSMKLHGQVVHVHVTGNSKVENHTEEYMIEPDAVSALKNEMVLKRPSKDRVYIEINASSFVLGTSTLTNDYYHCHGSTFYEHILEYDTEYDIHFSEISTTNQQTEEWSMSATVQEIPSQCGMVLPQAVPYQAISISDKVESRDKEIIVSIPIQKGTFSNDIVPSTILSDTEKTYEITVTEKGSDDSAFLLKATCTTKAQIRNNELLLIQQIVESVDAFRQVIKIWKGDGVYFNNYLLFHGLEYDESQKSIESSSQRDD